MIESNSVPKTTTMVMLPKEVWEGVASDIQDLKKMLAEKTADEVNKQWVESTEARKMLRVSPKTWQKYRDSRIIPFAQIGRKIFVRRADLEAFMQKHFIQAK